MLELTAEVMMPEASDRLDPWGDIEYRKSILRRLSDAIVEQVMDKITVRRIRDSATRQVRVEARLLVWERESIMGGRQPVTIKDEAMSQDEMLKEVDRLMKKAIDETPQAVGFLQSRIDRKKGIDEAIESSKAKVRVGAKVRDSIKTPGEALSVVKVKVRKIQMPEEA